MTIVQPGKVPTYTPSPNVQLELYDDADRTRFLFNGSQYVKAALVVSEPSLAYVGTFDGSASWYTNYKTSDGKYALVNGEYYVPVATGVPSASESNALLVGFPIQVSTSEIKLWGTSMLSYYEYLTVSYSYDGVFFFDISGASVTYGYDSDKERYVGEDPPTGLYYFTIALGATYSARYFRIQAYARTTVTTEIPIGGAVTISVASTTGFPSSWLTYPGITIGSYRVVYTGKTSLSLTGVSFESSPLVAIPVGTYAYFMVNFGHTLTEVEVLGTMSPTLEFWDTDGSKASTKVLPGTNYYDVIYDRGYDTYIAVRYNEALDGSGGIGFLPSDDFSESSLNTVRWTESPTEQKFYFNTASGTLDMLVPSGTVSDPGRITSNYYMGGDFTSSLDLGFNTISSVDARLELRAIDYSTDNLFVHMGVRGSWLYDGAKDGVWEASQVRNIYDTTGGVAYVRNFRINTGDMSASERFTFVYSSSSVSWGVTSTVRGSMADLLPGQDYAEDPITMTIVHESAPPDGAQIVLDVNLQQYNLPYVTWPWDWKVGIDRTGASVVCKYDSGTGFVNFVTFSDSEGLGLNLELYASGGTGFIDSSFDNLVVTGDDLFDGVPVFTLETIDSNGNVVQVAGLSDADGYVIKQFDVINSKTATYNSYISNRVQLATDSLTVGQGGSLYVKIGEDIYKYNKSLLPLGVEDGSSATEYMTSVIPETSSIAFGYSAYDNGALAYVEYDIEREGTYVRTLDTTTCSGTDYEAFLDVADSDYPWAWDQNNYTTLYYVDASDNIKMYDMDPRDVAFCNVVSSEKIMSAGTSATSSISATVLNVYGEPLSAKTVTFSITEGDGAIPTGAFCTNASGIASTTYTVGSTVGVVTITATASDTSC